MKTKNIKLSNRISLGLIALVIALTGTSGLFNTIKTSATSREDNFCTTQRCKDALTAEREASEKANSASTTADTLDGEINRLNQEIAMYETRIIANRAKSEDLAGQITENERKLEIQKEALADMIINMYLNSGNNDELLILANSSSLSDYAEKQTRLTSARDQISSSTEMVESLKNDLETQKKEVERIIADQEIQQKAIAETKRREEVLVTEYKANAVAFAAESAAARKVKEAEIAEAIRKNNSTGLIGSGINSYPKRGVCPRDNLGYNFYGGYVCQCVSYTGWKVYERYNIRIAGWGNANTWHINARNSGYRVDHTPEAGSVAVTTGGPYGHVMWIERVNDNGTVDLSEYNNSYSSVSGLPGDFGYRKQVSTSGMWFIHF